MAEVNSAIELVARAIWDRREQRFPKRLRRSFRRWDDLDESTGAKAAVLDEARAALIAIREPTSEMTSAFNRACDEHGQCLARYGWRVMIDAALSEPPKEDDHG